MTFASVGSWLRSYRSGFSVKKMLRVFYLKLGLLLGVQRKTSTSVDSEGHGMDEVL